MPGDPFQIDIPPTTPYRAAIVAARPLLSWLLGLRTYRALYERARSDVHAEEAQERFEAFRWMNRDRHAGDLRFGGVVPQIPIDAEPSIAAGLGESIEDGVGR